jgi:hypothetical protein
MQKALSQKDSIKWFEKKMDVTRIAQRMCL